MYFDTKSYDIYFPSYTSFAMQVEVAYILCVYGEVIHRVSGRPNRMGWHSVEPSYFGIAPRLLQQEQPVIALSPERLMLGYPASNLLILNPTIKLN